MFLHLLRVSALILGIFVCIGPVVAAEDPLSLEERLQQRLIRHQTIVATDAENIESLLVLAQTCERLGQWNTALEYYRQIRRLDASHGPAQRGCERLEKVLRTRLSLHWTHAVDEEYAAPLKTDDYRREENFARLSAEKQFGRQTWFRLDWLDGAMKQTSEFYQDTDFSLTYAGPALKGSLPLNSRFTFLGQAQYIRYREDGDESFYPLGEQDLLTGSATLNYHGTDSWLALSLHRYRDFDYFFEELEPVELSAAPEYRSALKVVAQTVYAMEAGRGIGANWSISGGLLYEDSKTLDPDQFQLRGRVFYNPDFVSNLRFSGQGDYYFEEEKTVVGVGAAYAFTLLRQIDTALSYVLLYTDTDDSWLHRGGLDVKWRCNSWLSLTLAADAGQETGDDQDSFYTLSSGLEVRF
jgi:hypothetical protein